MTKIKLCGLTRRCDIEAANALFPDYIGFVFAEKSRRYLRPEEAAELKKLLRPEIRAVGVFVNESLRLVKELLTEGIIDLAQLHGTEEDAYIEELKRESKKPVIKAFRIGGGGIPKELLTCPADHILLDSGAGSGEVLNWSLLKDLERPFFLAGGLSPDNVQDAVRFLHPFAADVSSGIETDGKKDPKKMAAFVKAVRGMEKGN